MENKTWQDAKLTLAQDFPFLLPFLVPTVEHATIKQIEDGLASGSIIKYEYEQLLFESHLSDVSALLDRCLAYRRDAREMEIEAVRFAIEYSKTAALLKIEDDLDKKTSEVPILEQEAAALRRAATEFEKVGGLGQGFSEANSGHSASAEARSSAYADRLKLQEDRRAEIRHWEEVYRARHEAPGSAHNYIERMERLVAFLAEDLYESYAKGEAVLAGINRIYSQQFEMPKMGYGLLDNLVAITRRVCRFLDSTHQHEVTYDLVVPLRQPWNHKNTSLVSDKEWKDVAKGRGALPIKFRLSPNVFNQTCVRVRAVGVSFGCADEPESTTSTSSSTTGSTNSTTKSFGAAYAKYRIRATIHTPSQSKLTSEYFRPPVVLGDVSIYGGGAALALDNSSACRNISPFGEWRIFLEQYAVRGAEGKLEVFQPVIFGGTDPIMNDIKLHLRITARFNGTGSAFKVES